MRPCALATGRENLFSKEQHSDLDVYFDAGVLRPLLESPPRPASARGTRITVLARMPLAIAQMRIIYAVRHPCARLRVP